MRARAGTSATVVIIGLSLLAGCVKASAPGPDAATDQAQIRAVLDQISGSFNAGDYDAMFAKYADDVVVVGPGQPELVGKAAWRAALAQLPKEVSLAMRFDTEELTVSGDLGYERGTF